VTRDIKSLRAIHARTRFGATAWFVTWVRRTLIALPVMLLGASVASATCWKTAGERYGIHPWLLAAIARVESGFDPNAVNDSHATRTGSVDLGLMQINSTWLPVLARHGITRERLFDPCTSIAVGAWILAELFARYGVTWEAVGAYNAACVRLDRAACTVRRARYARKVEAALRQLSGHSPIVLAGAVVERIVRVSIEELRTADANTADLPQGDGK
jgi:soluble lytic murein transglycosylase-like protein